MTWTGGYLTVYESAILSEALARLAEWELLSYGMQSMCFTAEPWALHPHWPTLALWLGLIGAGLENPVGIRGKAVPLGIFSLSAERGSSQLGGKPPRTALFD